MSKLIDAALVAAIGGSLIAGAYVMGQRTERRWWRAELAAKSQAVQATIARLGTEATDLDATLLRTIEGDRAKLEDAESTIRRMLNTKPTVVAPDDPCRPVPAQCLRRSGSGGYSAGVTASGR